MVISDISFLTPFHGVQVSVFELLNINLLLRGSKKNSCFSFISWSSTLVWKVPTAVCPNILSTVEAKIHFVPVCCHVLLTSFCLWKGGVSIDQNKQTCLQHCRYGTAHGALSAYMLGVGSCIRRRISSINSLTFCCESAVPMSGLLSESGSPSW